MHPEIIVLDFDSTFIQTESLEVLAGLSLKHHPEREGRLREIADLTRRGMDGTLSFGEGLSSRLRLIDATRKELDEAIEHLRSQVTPSALYPRPISPYHGSVLFISV